MLVFCSRTGETSWHQFCREIVGLKNTVFFKPTIKSVIASTLAATFSMILQIVHYVPVSSARASETEIWCRYVNKSGKPLLDTRCRASFKPARNCDGQFVNGRYKLEFSEKSSASIVPSCKFDKLDRVNGKAATPLSISINGREFVRLVLNGGDYIDFEEKMAGNSSVAPWSFQWKNQSGVGGRCKSSNKGVIIEAPCTRNEVCTHPQDGEGQCITKFEGFNRTYYKMRAVEGAYYHGEMEFTEDELRRDGDMECYPTSGGKHDFCFGEGNARSADSQWQTENEPGDGQDDKPSGDIEDRKTPAASQGTVFSGGVVFTSDNSAFAKFLEENITNVVYLDLLTGYDSMTPEDMAITEKCDGNYYYKGRETSTSYNVDKGYLDMGVTVAMGNEIDCGSLVHLDLKHATTDAPATGTGILLFHVSGFFQVSVLDRLGGNPSYDLKSIEAGLEKLQAAKAKAALLDKQIEQSASQ